MVALHKGNRRMFHTLFGGAPVHTDDMRQMLEDMRRVEPLASDVRMEKVRRAITMQFAAGIYPALFRQYRKLIEHREAPKLPMRRKPVTFEELEQDAEKSASAFDVKLIGTHPTIIIRDEID